MNGRAVLAASLVLAGCGSAAGTRGDAVAAPVVARGEREVPTEGAGPRVDASFVGPSRLLYEPATMRAPRPALRITITNLTREELDTSNVRARVMVTRADAPVPCGPDADRPRDAAEPAKLAPGASATFVRDVDCALRLTGTYVADLVVSFGSAAPWSVGRSVGTSRLTVVAPPDAAPRPLGAVPGVFAAIGAGATIGRGSLTKTEGAGRVVVALVNGTKLKVPLPPLRVAFAVRRHGTSIACVDEPVALDAPEVLDPGASHSAPLAVSCLGLGVPGDYDVEASMVVDDGGRRTEQPIGALRIEVHGDPARNGRVLR